MRHRMPPGNERLGPDLAAFKSLNLVAGPTVCLKQKIHCVCISISLDRGSTTSRRLTHQRFWLACLRCGPED